ncbi:type VI secretion system tip protein VgrG, partial [Klebsiella pneumoniae]|nr:type VI secretion system tip protein VgrG [Klebsiella pneumoniae]MDP0731410.1 type VI secretion system tip protein VgrG [Klebsiella pneumoniae]
LSKNGIEHGSEGMMVMKVANYLIPGTGVSLKGVTETFRKTTLELVPPRRRGRISR